MQMLGCYPMYAPQGAPAVCFSVLASSVIIVAARSCLLPPCVVPALGLHFHIPKLLSDASVDQPGGPIAGAYYTARSFTWLHGAQFCTKYTTLTRVHKMHMVHR